MTFDALRADLTRQRPPAGVEPSSARAELPPDLNVIAFASVDSTSRLARRLVDEFVRDETDPPRFLVVAHEQTAGRGRVGRSWESPAGGGVYASLVLTVDPALLDRLPLAVGVGLCEALGRWTGRRCRLKWPNDLVIDGRKIGGVLIQAVARGEAPAAVIIGFGVNLEGEPAARSTSLRREHASTADADAGAIPPPLPRVGELTSALAGSLLAEIARSEQAPAATLASYRELSAHAPGDRLGCQLGDERLEGEFLGLDEHGGLRLRTAAGDRVLRAGEVIEG